MIWASVLLFVPLCAAGDLVPLRSRVEAFKGSGAWEAVEIKSRIEPSRTALLLCDMWDNHWCRGAAARVDLLARRMGPLLAAARRSGVLVIHAPSETMDFYKDTPQRKAVLAIAPVAPPSPLSLSDPPLPIDDSDGGCDTAGDRPHKAWTREHAAISIGPDDLISDRGTEVYGALRSQGINTLLVMGVHTNMCVLTRGFAIRQMTRWGIRCILVRDLTDAMYNPAMPPRVSHEQGTALVIEHIEKYWCPSVTSGDLLRSLRRRVGQALLPAAAF